MSVSTFAQENNQGGNREQRRPDTKELIQRRTDDVVKKYSLNETQAKQLLDLNTKYADIIAPNFGGRFGGRGGQFGQGGQGGGQFGQGRPQLTDEQRAKFEEERKQRTEKQKAYNDELAKILTADQLKAYQKDLQSRGPREGRDGRRGPRGQRPE